MKKTQIIETLKTHYNRDLRKQVVKTLLKDEKETSRPDYRIIDQIFLYIQKELDWKLPYNEEAWDYTPLDIMKEVFPHIESSKWYDIQLSAAKKTLITIEANRNAKQ